MHNRVSLSLLSSSTTFFTMITKFFLFLFFSVFIGAALIIGVTYRTLKLQCGRSRKIDYAAVRKRNHKMLITRHTTEAVSFTSQDGLRLSGMLVYRPLAQRVILLCHGRWQAKEFLYPLADIFTTDTLLFFDFRTHGASEGNLVSLGHHETKDVQAARRFLETHKHTKHMPVYGIGFSMGAAALLNAVCQGSVFEAVAIDSAFAHLHTQMCRLFTRTTKLPSCLLSLSQCIYEALIKGPIEAVSPRAFLQNISLPVLIMHSQEDHVVPVEDAYELYASAQGAKELWIVKGARHAYLYKLFPQAYKNTVDDFFKRAQRLKV